MNNETQSSRFRFGSKAASVLLSAAILATTFTGLGSSLVSTKAEAASDYGLCDNIQDGNILHCFCWKHQDIIDMLPQIAEAGFTTVQVSPTQSTGGTGAWWWFYQPLGFYIGSSAMGDKGSLTRLCSEADKYGIKIVADIVANHLAGDHSRIQDDLKDSQYWHEGDYSADDGDRYRVTHGRIGMPDLNTEHSYVQQCVKNYVQELKSVGVDGIRFDAAKHIGLPSEGDNFWPTVTSDTSLWYYGEILNNPGLSYKPEDGQREQAISVMKQYSNYIGITDSPYGMTLRNNFNDGQAPTSYGNYCDPWMGLPSSRLVYWAESHDTWSNNHDWGYSNDISQNNIDRAYAIAGSRNGITALYFSRPSSKDKDSIMIGAKGSTHFTSKEVAAVNHFKNAMNGTKDYFVSENNVAAVCRPGGVVVALGSGSDRDVTISNGGSTVTPGTYTDEISGSTWTVTSTTISGHVGSTGIAVVYNGKGSVSISPNGGTFKTETTTVTLNAKSATDTTYTTSEGDSGSYTDGKTITIGSKTSVGGTITVTVNGKNSEGSPVTATATFTKQDQSAAVTVNVDNSAGNWSSVYAYVYNGDGESTVAMAPWPGTKMSGSNNYYTLDVTGFENGRVIFSDGSGSASNRYPANMEPGLQIGGKSMVFTAPNKWEPAPGPTPKLSVSLSASPTTVNKGGTVTLTATATGATGSVNYAFKAGSETITSSGNTATWTANTTGTVTFTVTATDSSGSATASASVTVKGDDTNDPTVVSNKASGTEFTSETLDITLTLQNATSGTYSVDGGPTKKFSGSQVVTIGEGKIGDSTITVNATATGSSGTKNYSFTYKKKYVVKTTSSSAGTLSKYYATNAKGKGANKTISVDGDLSDWDSSMLIAQGTANDDPRVYRPNSMYEVPVDLYALYAAYDDNNLYLMWEMTNVQDVVAPIDDYPISQGTLWMTQEFPFFIVVDTGKSDKVGNNGKTSTGGTLWNSGMTITSPFNRIISINTKGGNGPFVYGGDSSGLNPVEMLGPKGGNPSGAKMKFGQGILSKTVNGIDKAYGNNNGRVVGDMCNESAAWVEFNSKGHNSASLDFFYEMSIPLSELGVTKSDITSTGLGVLLCGTMGKSCLDCLPYDLSMNDNADKDDSAGSQENNSFEKSDEDNITCAFARVGAGDTPVPPPPVPPDDETPLQVNFGADKSAPQLTTTSLTLKGIGYGGTAPYKYAFYVDGTQVQASSTTDSYTWKPGTAKTHKIKCVITDSTGATATSEKNFTAESSGPDDPLSLSASLSATSVAVNTSVTIKASASGGKTPYQFAFYVKKSTDSSFTTFKDFSTTASASYKPTTKGTYNIKVKVKDAASTVDSQSLTLTVTDNPDPKELTNTSTISASKISLGSSITINCSATGGTPSYQYAVYYKKSSDSKYTSLQALSSNAKLTFKPTEATVYNVQIRVKDKAGTVRTVTHNLTVIEGLTNASVISATKINLGSTVKVTGKATNGTTPYTYAFYVKKSTESSYTTMQTFGSNNVLTIKPEAVGTYNVVSKVKDKTGAVARKQFNVTVTKDLTNNSTISATKIALGDTVKVTGKAAGGTSPYKYAFYYKKASDSKYVTKSDFGKATSVSIKPAAATKYSVVVKVKDAKKTIARKEFTVTVSNPLKNNSTVSATSIALGSSITVTGKASGGTSPYKYAFYYKKASDSKYVTKSDFGKATSVSIKPAAATKYSVVVKVKDAKTTIARKEFTVTVSNPLKNNSTVSATSIALGSSITVTGKASGGTSPYKYAFYYKKASDSSYVTKSDFGKATSITLKPNTATKYSIVVKVKDAKKTVARKEFTVNVSNALKNNSTISSTSIALGNSITVTGKASGGTSPYKYAFYYKKASDSSYVTKSDFGKATSITLKPNTATKYSIVVKVKDAKKTVARKEFTLNVTSALKNTSTISATSIKLGNSITVTGKASGGTSPYKYAFYYKKAADSSYVTKSDFGKATSMTIKPNTATKYSIVVKVKDANKTVVRKEFTVSVTK